MLDCQQLKSDYGPDISKGADPGEQTDKVAGYVVHYSAGKGPGNLLKCFQELLKIQRNRNE